MQPAPLPLPPPPMRHIAYMHVTIHTVDATGTVYTSWSFICLSASVIGTQCER